LLRSSSITKSACYIVLSSNYLVMLSSATILSYGTT